MPFVAANTPVIVGASQFTERIDDPDYAMLSPVAITARAAELALADAGMADCRGHIDTLMTTRIFEDSAPHLEGPFGRSNNFPRSVCQRLGMTPETAIWATSGGDTPQKLVTEACDRIWQGDSKAVLVSGGEALSTTRFLQKQGSDVDWSESSNESVVDRKPTLDYATHDELMHGLVSPPLFYGIMENARRIAAGVDVKTWADQMGALFAPFAAVASKNPLAAQRDRAFSPADLVTIETGNRRVVDAYPQRLVARDQVNQSAALVVISTALADELNIPTENRVYLHGQATAGELPITLRPELGQAPSAGLALRRALERANCNTDDISYFDFYSCFPIAVSNAIDAIGLSGDDPRGLTVTGGLPFFGGPGNSYSMHALAEMVTCLRVNPGKFGLVAANGGLLSKYAVGIYATTPAAYEPYDSADLQEEMSKQTAPDFEKNPSGEGRLEAYTVAYDRDGQPKAATIVGRLLASDARFIAKVGRDAPTVLDVFSRDEADDRYVVVTPSELGNSFIFCDAVTHE